jgi:hypothetical protein
VKNIYTQRDNKISCPKCCTTGSVWCGYWDNKVHYKCKRCRGTWLFDAKNYQRIVPINILTGPSQIHTAYGVFYGLWTSDEVARVEQIIGESVSKIDWNFFKGKSIVTAWRSNSVPGEMFMAKRLEQLLLEVEHFCLLESNLVE